jgi:predicted MFS family arabinose efflux permease
VSVSLAGSLFFNVSPDASRQQVLLYLLVTMDPLAVLAPLVGPAVDRFRRSQRFVASLFYLLRAVSCLALVSFLLDIAFYPLALILLIASKASGVVKQTLVQVLVDDPNELVATNARLARFASITAAVGAGVAVGVLQAGGAQWTLRVGAALFALSALSVLKVRSRVEVDIATDELEYAETHLPVVFVGSIGIIAIRAAVGFFLFTLAFTLRRDSQPAYVYGLAGGCYGAGAFAGHTIIGFLRRRFREQQLIALAIAAPAAFTMVGVLGVSTPLLMVIAAMGGLSTTLGRNAFDSLLQRRAPEALLGRAGARYETRFQLAWVLGGAIATPITLAPEVSMMVLTGIYVPGLFMFLKASRDARHFEEASPTSLDAARQRIVVARQLWDVGEFRSAIVDASAAADLAQTVHGSYSDRSARVQLDALRRAAIDPAREIGSGEAIRSIEVATALVDSVVTLAEGEPGDEQIADGQIADKLTIGGAPADRLSDGATS